MLVGSEDYLGETEYSIKYKKNQQKGCGRDVSKEGALQLQLHWFHGKSTLDFSR